MTTSGPLSRLLFVGRDAAWQAVAGAAAARCGAVLDVQPTVRAALDAMLAPGPVYDHVLAVAPIRSRAADALAGMLDEVTLRPTPLLLLGCAHSGMATPIACVQHADVDGLLAALGAGRAAGQSGGRMSPDELAATLHAGGLRMRFQPILRAADLVPIGMEALARLHDSGRGIVHPKNFVQVILDGGRERVLTGIAAARTFLEFGEQLRGTTLFATLNLPLSTVMNDAAVRRGMELCAVGQVPPGQIMLEVLESSTMPDLGALRAALDSWREAGFRLAIDDAGPALPHWRALLELPFDALKLDGAMVSDRAQHALLETIVAEAKARRIFVVAEGIETQACLDRVLALGVDAVQGFMFARPLPALAVPLWLERWAKRGS